MSIRAFQLERYLGPLEFQAKYLLCASDCETMSVGELLDLAGVPPAELAKLRLGYTESQGDPALRELIARFYPGLVADNVLVTNAPEEGIFLAIHALLNPGDRVIVQTPCYQSLSELAMYRGCKVEPWPLVETATGWRMDLDRLAGLLQAETRLLVINAPHNPTGYLPSRAEFDTILELAAQRGTWLLSDEMYRGLEYDPAGRLPPASTCYERAISLWGMSKTFGLAGLRIGWLALPDQAALEALIRWKDYTTICSSAPGEFLTRLALEQAEAISARSVAIIQANLAHIRRFMAEASDWFDWREPLAGPIAFVRLPRGGAAAFCQRLVREQGILLVPSTVFDFGDNHVRFGLGRRNFPEGLTALQASLSPVGQT